MAAAGGETRKTITVAGVYTINRCIEWGLCVETTKEAVWLTAQNSTLCSAANVFAAVGGCSHRSLFVNM